MKPSTAKAEEIAQFTRLAEKWWDTNGEFRPLHQLNPVRLAYIRNRLCDYFNRDAQSITPLKGLTLVDVGCGGGLVTEPMCRLGADVTGIDAGAETINAARHHANEMGLSIDYQHILPENLPAECRQFDIVLNLEVIEHVADRALFLETTSKILKPGGAMILSTLNRTLKSFALAKVSAEYLLRWVPVGTHDWRQFIQPAEIAKEISPHGLKIRDVTGLSFSPLDRSWRESSDLKVNYILFATKNLSAN